jgi:hypothetical protein
MFDAILEKYGSMYIAEIRRVTSEDFAGASGGTVAEGHGGLFLWT